jgi:hypothetical protein
VLPRGSGDPSSRTIRPPACSTPGP